MNPNNEFLNTRKRDTRDDDNLNDMMMNEYIFCRVLSVQRHSENLKWRCKRNPLLEMLQKEFVL